MRIKTRHDFKICSGDYIDQDILEKFEAAKEELKRLHVIRGKINANMDNHTLEQKFTDFIEDLNIPQRNDEEKSFPDKDLTINDLKEALNSFANNKSPGEDFLKSFNEAFCKGSLSVSQKRGTITLIPKGDENLTELKNWRPISLLNIDYKILSKALARRMEKVLPKLVHSDQTGFVNGRYIRQNIRLLNDIVDYTDIKKKLPGIFLFVDFEKAFDTIEWSLYQKRLKCLHLAATSKTGFLLFTIIYKAPL